MSIDNDNREGNRVERALLAWDRTIANAANRYGADYLNSREFLYTKREIIGEIIKEYKNQNLSKEEMASLKVAIAYRRSTGNKAMRFLYKVSDYAKPIVRIPVNIANKLFSNFNSRQVGTLSNDSIINSIGKDNQKLPLADDNSVSLLSGNSNLSKSIKNSFVQSMGFSNLKHNKPRVIKDVNPKLNNRRR